MNALRRALADGKPTFGYLVTMPSVQLVQVLSRSGVDWLMFDMEHAPIGIEAIAAMIAATGGTNAAPLVRVPGHDSALAKPVLDCGAAGIVFPMIGNRAEAEATVRAARYAPAGKRGFGPTYAALRWGQTPVDYLRGANDSIVNIVLVESVAAVEALDEILAVDGIDVVAVARGDLSENLGVPGQFDHPQLREVVETAERKILAHGRVALGGIAFNGAEATTMIARGHRFLVLGSDAGMILGTATAAVKAARGG
jgi:4-hydroxy-2-oxoheptanedioate aldolase